MRLAEMFRMPLVELRAKLDAEELALWRAWEDLYRLPAQRLQTTLAVVGSAVCGCHGNDVPPERLIPKWIPPTVDEEHERRFAEALAEASELRRIHGRK